MLKRTTTLLARLGLTLPSRFAIVWPTARLGIYCKFFYHAQGAAVGFDPEFPVQDPGEVCRLRLKI